jgi:2-dehydropantoate 2-reductase
MAQRITGSLDNQRRVSQHERVQPLSIVIVGAGGVGGYFGARLARAGERVMLVARGAHLAAIRRDGLRVRSSVEGEFTVKVDATDTLAGRPPADVVLLCVKAYDTDAALDAAAPVVGPDTAVLSLQNGVDHAERIAARLGPGSALGGAAYVFAVIEAPGVIAHRFAGRIALGELDGRVTPRAERLRDALARAGIPGELTTDIRRVLWEKYLFIGAQAGVTALTRCPTGVVRAVPETWALYRTILEELAAVGRAAGVALRPDAVDAIMAQAERLAPETTSSLADDLARGRRLELEALHGHAVRLGRRSGVPTPAVFAVYAALKPHADGGAAATASRGGATPPAAAAALPRTSTATPTAPGG